MISANEIERVTFNHTPEEIEAQLRRLRLTQVEGAELLRIHPRTMRRYLQAPGTPGSTPMPFPTFALLRLTKRGAK